MTRIQPTEKACAEAHCGQEELTHEGICLKEAQRDWSRGKGHSTQEPREGRAGHGEGSGGVSAGWEGKPRVRATAVTSCPCARIAPSVPKPGPLPPAPQALGLAH